MHTQVAGLDKGQVEYTPGFSEENVYHLIDTLLDFEQARSIDELSVVFVGNRTRKVWASVARRWPRAVGSQCLAGGVT